MITSRAHPAPITFNTALPVTQGSGIVRVQGKILEFDDGALGQRNLRVRIAPIVLVWGLTERWALFGITPYVDKELASSTGSGTVTRSSSGFGDLALLARYTAFQRDDRGSSWRLAPFVGIEAPTGKDDLRDEHGLLPPPLQPGSGSWDFSTGAVLTRQTLGWEIDASLAYRWSGEGNGFEFGDEARLDLSYQKRAWPRELDAGVGAFLYGVVESNVVWRDRNRARNVEDPDSGGMIWYLAPGIQYVRKRTILETSLQFPVSQSLYGDALESDFVATVSARVNF